MNKELSREIIGDLMENNGIRKNDVFYTDPNANNLDEWKYIKEDDDGKPIVKLAGKTLKIDRETPIYINKRKYHPFNIGDVRFEVDQSDFNDDEIRILSDVFKSGRAFVKKEEFVNCLNNIINFIEGSDNE